jgi:hypothetical protein
MKILVTGRGGAASWTIRGEQLGRAMGATVKPMATLAECRAADVIVVVKRVPDELLHAVRQSGRPWVYDIVDAYPQPHCADWSPAQARQWLHDHLQRLQPAAVVWPNQRMRADAAYPGWVLYHHHRPGIDTMLLRDRIYRVGYEGRPEYLAGWIGPVVAECKRIGAEFVINPATLSQVDVVLALRAGKWNGYCQRHWKSNVKLANAHGAGVPFIGLPEAGYLETAAGGEQLIESPAELGQALDMLADGAVRTSVQDKFLANAYSVDQAAADMKANLCALKS